MLFCVQTIFVTILLLAVPAGLYLLGRRSAPQIFRRLAYETHLWLGIVSSLVLFIVCLSGTALTFKTEMIMFFEQNRYCVHTSDTAVPKSLAELVPLIEKAEKGKVVRITIPADKKQAWIFNVKKEDTGGAKLPAGMPPAVHAMLGTACLVNPYTGESPGLQRSSLYMFFMMLTFLHRFLLLDIRTGQIIVGSATLIFLVLVAGGLCLWFPPKLRVLKAWLLGMKIRTKGGWGKFLFDLHNTLGFYALIPVTIMALTGPVISFGWYRSAVEKALGAKPFGRLLEKPVVSKGAAASVSFLTIDDFLVKGNAMTQRKGMIRISLPQSPDGSVTYQKIGAGFCELAAVDKIQFDRYTGEVLKSDLFDDIPFNEQIASLIFPLHTGEIFGTVSKVIYFTACLIAASLPVTGLFLWGRKLRSRYIKSRRLRQDKLSP
ncbi:MAG: PepSY domain-containing protein [Planctomycetaceae bacterium]|jgi:uncharacterized iron-regulated membrane protein|nr:PepSY domain-containing protein [Planctomycetaceae bacterium]